MLLIGLENSRSPLQCFLRPLLPMLLRTTHFLPHELAERQFLLKSSRVAPARVGALKQTLRVHLRAGFKINKLRQSVIKPKSRNWAVTWTKFMPHFLLAD
jgi:hypothetical protein